MHGEKKCADTLTNRVLSECKVCEGEMKLTTSNDEHRFKMQYLEHPDEKQSIQDGLHRPNDDSTNQTPFLICKIKDEKLLDLTSI
jgi:hypothetical protein